MKEISVIIPILNESENIKLLVPEIFKNIKYLKIFKYEIILVDDNSEDSIKSVVKKLKKNNKVLRLIIRKKKIETYLNRAYLGLIMQNIKIS